MFKFDMSEYLAPAVADRVVKFRNTAGFPPILPVENLDGSASAAVRAQESDDNVNYTDIAGTSITLNPGEQKTIEFISTKPFLALHAGGNVRLLVGILRGTPGSPTDIL